MFNPQKIDERVLQRVISDPLFRQRFVLQYGREELDNILVPKVRNQNGGTCYAHACTCILMLVLSRIVGRRIPGYEELSQEIINQFGTDGGFPETVFDHFCPRYQLRWTEINITETKQRLRESRPILAYFYLTDKQWKNFSKFFKNNPKGILNYDLLSADSGPETKTSGHAVVIQGMSEGLSEHEGHWIIRNSWGESFGHGGYFKLRMDAIPLKFLFVYFLEIDLTSEDKTNYIKFMKTDEQIGDQLYRVFGNYDCYHGAYHSEHGIHGKGKYFYANGRIYEGRFERNKRHGEGRLIFEDGSFIDGYWGNDVLIKSSQNSLISNLVELDKKNLIPVQKALSRTISPRIGKIRNIRTKKFIKATDDTTGLVTLVTEDESVHGKWIMFNIRKYNGPEGVVLENIKTTKNIRVAGHQNGVYLVVEKENIHGNWIKWIVTKANHAEGYLIQNYYTKKYLQVATNGKDLILVNEIDIERGDWMTWEVL